MKIKKFFKRIVSSITLSIITLLLIVIPVLGATVDFTAFTEVDPTSTITVSNSVTSWAGLAGGGGDSGTYMDFGADNLTDNYVYEFAFEAWSAMVDATAQVHFMVSENGTLNYGDQNTARDEFAVLYTDRENPLLRGTFKVLSNNGDYTPVVIENLSLDTIYYAVIEFDTTEGIWGTWYCSVYEDEAHTILMDSGEQELYNDGHYRFLFSSMLWSDGTSAAAGQTREMTMVIATPDVSAFPPEVTTLGTFINFIADSTQSGIDMNYYGLEWGTSTGNYTDNITWATSTTYLASNLFIPSSNLTWGDTYYCRVFATNGEYGYSNEKMFVFNPNILTITAGTPNWSRLGTSDNYTAAFRVTVTPVEYSDNVTAILGDLPGSDNYTLSGSFISSNGQWAFTTDDYPLSDNTTYYYQGTATVNGTDYDSNIGFFTTTSQILPDAPVVIITGITDVTDDYSWLDDSADNAAIELKARVTNGNIDSIFYYVFDLSRSVTGEYLDNPIYIYAPSNINADGSFEIVVFLSAQSWYTITDTVYIQASVSNGYGLDGKSAIQSWKAESTTSPGGTGIDNPTPISDTLNSVKASLGLYGDMGSWALMFIILMGLSLLIAPVVFAVKDSTRTAVSIVWALLAISVLGAFIFTGELGIWPIIIMAGGLAVLVMIIAGTILSGNRGGA